MKKETGIRKMTKPVAAALCAAALFVSAAPAYAEELVAEDTQTVGAREATRYDLQNNGDSWDNAHYYLADGTLAKDCFFSDGVYTYYLQSDGSPMTNRLTYHPDGEHIIYFDENGHEVFSNFTNVKQSISGEAVDDLCFFDVYGYMYVRSEERSCRERV